MEADFSGYATRNGLKCSDGLTIMRDAFKHNDGKKVPLVWGHEHNEPLNVLGHVLLENRKDGVYAYGFFNGTAQALAAKTAVAHGDITALSIYANRLKKQGLNVQHGDIKEVSLVLAGANPGAYIEKVAVQHGDDIEELEDEAVIFTGLEFSHSDSEESDDQTDEDESTEEASHAEADDKADETEGENMANKSAQDVFGTLNDEQKDLVHYLVAAAAETVAEHSDTDDTDDETTTSEEDESDSSSDDSANDDNITHDQEGQNNMSRNVFEQNGDTVTASKKESVLSHDDMKELFQNAVRLGSAKEAVEDYALKHGITDIETMFPDAMAISNTPEFQKRRTEWVATVMDGTHKTPFSRIKSLMADITPDEARAKGYIKGNLKKEEFFKVSKRVTTPQTVYKKQKLDRDDIIDITDFDVVAWLKGEMRLMLEEEIARAVLVGDGRSLGDEDKINEENIRPILTDHELYVTTVNVNLADVAEDADEIVDAVTMNRRHYRGSGSPKFFCSDTVLATMLLVKDTLGRRIYKDVTELAAALRVTAIVPVEVFEEYPELVGIMVDLRDYNIGTNRGGDVSLFDDFDIDYNQYKYLIETRLSGALVKWKAAIVVKQVAAADVLVTPAVPVQTDDDTVTITPTTGVTYTAQEEDGTPVTITANAVTLTAGNSPVTVKAAAQAGYYFENNADDEWTFSLIV
jgi:HK97 family phage prohead protease